MRRMLLLTLFLLLLSACAVPAETEEPSAPPLQEAPEEPAPAEASPEEEVPVEEVPSEDHVLLTLDAPLADGRTLRLEAVGKRVDEYSVGVREVRVYDGDALIQTILSREAIQAEWDEGMPEAFYHYTECWSPEESMEVLDLNFDGSADFGLFGWICNNTIPYYYWIWDAETEQYQYAFPHKGRPRRCTVFPYRRSSAPPGPGMSRRSTSPAKRETCFWTGWRSKPGRAPETAAGPALKSGSPMRRPAPSGPAAPA